MQKIFPPPDFDPRTVPSAASRYTDYPGPQNSDPYSEDRHKLKHLRCAHTPLTIKEFAQHAYSWGKTGTLHENQYRYVIKYR